MAPWETSKKWKQGGRSPLESSNPGERRHGALVVEVAMDAVGRDKMMLMWTGYKSKEKSQECGLWPEQ